ncbi:MAG: cellulase family glycosylhydrolase [Chloroflexota bacterium]
MRPRFPTSARSGRGLLSGLLLLITCTVIAALVFRYEAGPPPAGEGPAPTATSAPPAGVPAATSRPIPTAQAAPPAGQVPVTRPATTPPPPTPTAPPEPKLRGVNVFLQFGRGGTAKNAQQFRLARDVGADIIRGTVLWSEVEPGKRGEYNAGYLARLDEIVAQAEEQRLKPVFSVALTPCWASGDPNKNCRSGKWKYWYPPEDPEDYAAVFGYLTARYRDRVLAWEIWNEPNLSKYWGDIPPDPVKYTQMVRAVRSSSPDAFLLAGSLSFSDVGYLESMYDSGAQGAFDALALHPYTWRPPSDCSVEPEYTFACGIEKIRRLMIARGDERDIWFTEFGWTSLEIGEPAQAAYLASAYSILERWPYVRAAAWYSLLDRAWDTPGFSSADRECCFGLYRADATGKPAARAMRRLPLSREDGRPIMGL